ncbi:MAG TPA: RagB/SusD family nutrient uptake outer membrane protein [Cyclobacteriaceae bacterium]|nr:RagB/SusD family nutrient uptake outer membrane protein [Cyclobacteriaceae bacterium]
MKRFKKYRNLTLLVISLMLANCSNLLDEEPRTQIVPAFFDSPEGLLGGLAGVYNSIRGSYGTEGFTLQTMAGTDDHLRGGGAGPIFFTYNGIASTSFNGAFGIYTSINTLNGIIEIGPTAGLPESDLNLYLGQAYFLRAFLYYDLVKTFGDVPLHTEFNTTPSRADSKSPALEVYDVILSDLNEAINRLPDQPAAPFLGKAATKAAALFLLGKAQLSRGWLTGNNTDFQNAYTTLNSLITDKTAYGLDLWQDYGDAFEIANDYGKENIFVSDHSNDATYGLYQLGASGGAAQNLTPWFQRWNYSGGVLGANSTYSAASDAWTFNSASNMFNRDVENGRPYLRMRLNAEKLASGPNAGKSYIYDQAFVNRDVDTRYSKTFKTVWIVNKTSTGSRGDLVAGDTGVYFVDYEEPGAPYAIGARPFKGIVVTPSMQTDQVWPAVKKFDDPTRAAPNDPSTRPVVLFRFADTYLLAAEAAFKAGNNDNAAAMINVIRRRAAYDKNLSDAENAANATAMEITAGDVTLDFILDERTREFYGEGLRWFDLTRTQSLLSRVAAWNPVEAGTLIQPYHVLRPIPQDQIDRVTEGDCQGNECWQNPGYF